MGGVEVGLPVVFPVFESDERVVVFVGCVLELWRAVWFERDLLFAFVVYDDVFWYAWVSDASFERVDYFDTFCTGVRHVWAPGVHSMSWRR